MVKGDDANTVNREDEVAEVMAEEDEYTLNLLAMAESRALIFVDIVQNHFWNPFVIFFFCLLRESRECQSLYRQLE